MPQNVILLVSLSVSALVALYIRHQRAERKRQEWLADHRAMVNYLSGTDDELGGHEKL